MVFILRPKLGGGVGSQDLPRNGQNIKQVHISWKFCFQVQYPGVLDSRPDTWNVLQQLKTAKCHSIVKLLHWTISPLSFLSDIFFSWHIRPNWISAVARIQLYIDLFQLFSPNEAAWCRGILRAEKAYLIDFSSFSLFSPGMVTQFLWHENLFVFQQTRVLISVEAMRHVINVSETLIERVVRVGLWQWRQIDSRGPLCFQPRGLKSVCRFCRLSSRNVHRSYPIQVGRALFEHPHSKRTVFFCTLNSKLHTSEIMLQVGPS